MQSTFTVHSATINWVSEYVLDTVALCRTELTILPVSLSLSHSLSLTHSLIFLFLLVFFAQKRYCLKLPADCYTFSGFTVCVSEWVNVPFGLGSLWHWHSSAPSLPVVGNIRWCCSCNCSSLTATIFFQWKDTGNLCVCVCLSICLTAADKALQL